jgi:hypothetical protein
VAKNDDGEFELVLGNNQLLSVFFLVVLLLALCFIGGYVVGRNAAPMLAAGNTPKESKAPAAVEDTEPEPPAVAAKRKEEPAPKPAPKVEPEVQAPKMEATKTEVKATALPAPPPGKQPPVSSQPVSGRVYLQLSATDKDRAETMVDLIRSKSMPAIAAAIADRPNLYRVLVGPLTDNTVAETRDQLKANGFPADEAIRRVF